MTRTALTEYMEPVSYTHLDVYKRQTGRRCKLHVNGTPLINPIRSGGSPIGVRQPPILEIRNIKNIII